MFRRLLLSALTVLALLTPVATTQARAATTATRTTGYAVYYRSGNSAWYAAGTFATSAEARRASDQLVARGYTVFVRSADLAVARPAVAADTVTLAQATTAFRAVAGRQDIAFRFVEDGCYARAHLMVGHLQALGMRPRKAWAFGDLYASTPNHPDRHVAWNYHVAPTLRVRDQHNRVVEMVIDPSLATRPVTVAEWRALMTRPQGQVPSVCLTNLGQAPVKPGNVPVGGHGFWPGNDPADANAFAVYVMRMYKPYEGKRAPTTVYTTNVINFWRTNQAEARRLARM